MRDYREKTERETRRFDLIILFMVNKKVTSYSLFLQKHFYLIRFCIQLESKNTEINIDLINTIINTPRNNMTNKLSL